MASWNCHRHRRGVSILEVLFAILITSIGLMGAIAVFPAAIMQAKRGQQADSAAVAGLRCIHDFDAQGMRRPDRWLLPSATAPPGWPGGNPVPPTMRSIDGQWAYCIDPRFVAANRSPATATVSTDANTNYFPYAATASPMLRVTLNNGGVGSTIPMSDLLAELNFRIEDDIAYDRFNDKIANTDENLHAASLFVRNGTTALKRESHGHMSWMATLAPKLERLPSGITFEDRYVLSVVVFYDRPTQLLASGSYPVSEWAVNVTLPGGGVGGGEVTLSGTTAEQVDVRNGQWIMLMAQTVNSGHRMPLCRWYRVIDADEPIGTASPYTNDVTLSGGDFTDFYDPNPGVRAIICRGVVAVYEKTIKLETRL